ncbi:MAG TPA: terminase TerL endonuclease subunit, partial [Gammaproteobacteria bacterium]|nr:terminase TerL endonuclease subunit [Gammaproteobacteria bacterium]
VARRLCEICDDYQVESVFFDRWRIDVLKKELERLGVELPLVPFGQGFKDMSPALDSLESELLNGRIRHGGNPIMTMCAANAVIDTDAAGNRKLNKAKSTGRIDGMVALAMTMNSQAVAEEFVSGAFCAV